VVVNDDAERLRRGNDRLRHLDIGAGGVDPPKGDLCTSTMAVADRSSAPFHHLAHIDGCVVHGSLLLYFVGDDLIALIEKTGYEILKALN
jgi:hypothetical protein